jgi:hypothetical protein
MNNRWARSNEILFAFLVIAMVAVGVLTVLVVRQHQDQTTENGQVYLVETAPAAGAPSNAITSDPADVPTKPDTHSDTRKPAPAVAAPLNANTPDPANVPTNHHTKKLASAAHTRTKANTIDPAKIATANRPSSSATSAPSHASTAGQANAPTNSDIATNPDKRTYLDTPETASATGARSKANTPDPDNLATNINRPSNSATGAPSHASTADQANAPTNPGIATKPDKPACPDIPETASATGARTKVDTPDPAHIPTKPDNPPYLDTSETAPETGARSEVKLPESANIPTNRHAGKTAPAAHTPTKANTIDPTKVATDHRSSNSPTGASSHASTADQANAPTNPDIATKPELPTNRNKPFNRDTRGTAVAPRNDDQARAGVPPDGDQFVQGP